MSGARTVLSAGNMALNPSPLGAVSLGAGVLGGMLSGKQEGVKWAPKFRVNEDGVYEADYGLGFSPMRNPPKKPGALDYDPLSGKNAGFSDFATGKKQTANTVKLPNGGVLDQGTGRISAPEGVSPGEWNKQRAIHTVFSAFAADNPGEFAAAPVSSTVKTENILRSVGLGKKLGG